MVRHDCGNRRMEPAYGSAGRHYLHRHGWVTISIASAAALSVLASAAAARMSWADDGDAPPKPPPFRPWQEVWQCNDVRVTITSRSPEEIEYDLGGMIWGGSRFTVVRGNLFFNGRPCVPLRPVGHWSGRARPSRR